MSSNNVDLSYLHEYHADEPCGCGNVGVGPDGFCAECLGYPSKVPMTKRASYIAGVRKAEESRQARQKRIDDAIADLRAATAKRDEVRAKAAKEGVEGNRAKYGGKPAKFRRMVGVLRGAKPWRGSMNALFDQVYAETKDAETEAMRPKEGEQA